MFNNMHDYNNNIFAARLLQSALTIAVMHFTYMILLRLNCTISIAKKIQQFRQGLND